MFTASRYNIVTPLKAGRALLYNSHSLATALLDEEEYQAFKNISDSPAMDVSLLQDLRYGGFVVEDGTDELAIIERDYRTHRFDATSMVLTVAPTLMCNFGCDYCFQGADKPKGKMSDQVQGAVVRMVETLLPGLRRMHVAWYGGEPLLALDIVEKLSDKFTRLCDESRIPYDAMIVTNGFRLTPSVAKSLHARRVTVAQVTLDGAMEDHDGRRALLGGQGTFTRIVDNILSVIEQVPLRITTRINIDSRNSAGVPDLLAQLSGRGLGHRTNFSVYFAPVEALTEGCHAVASSCMSKGEYAALESQLHRLAYDLGLAALPYPGRFRGVCGALRPRGYVVVPSGDLHKCWDTVTMPGMRIGNVFNFEHSSESEQARTWSEWTPFENESCRSCKLLPTCAGSCAHKFVNPDQTLGEAASLPCPSWKYQARERLVMLAEQSGVISAEDYSPGDIATDPLEICPVPPVNRKTSSEPIMVRRMLPIVEVR